MERDVTNEDRAGMAPPAERFRTVRSTLIVDRVMTGIIKIGGLGIIVTVFAIFGFIVWQIVPLFRGASVAEAGTMQAPPGKAMAIGIDEWGERPFVAYADGTVAFLGAGSDGRTTVLPEGVRPTCVHYDLRTQSLAMGTDDGTIVRVGISYSAEFADGKRVITASASGDEALRIGPKGVPLVAVAIGDSGGDKLAAAILGTTGKRSVMALVLEHEEGLLGSAGAASGSTEPIDLTSLVPGTPERLLVDDRAESILVMTREGDVCYLFRQGHAFERRQIFAPFGDLPVRAIASMDYLLGDVSAVLTSPTGENRIFSLYYHPGADKRTFGQTKELAALPGPALGYAASTRNKAFAVISGSIASLRYGTTAQVRWQKALPFEPSAVTINGKYDRMALLDGENRLHLMTVHDPHPEAGIRALFGKVWYEGAPEAKFEWQSTGGSDDFEPKLSMVNLLFGTIKGTFYAMLFAVPIAILGAVYTAEFMRPSYRSVIKPTVEIMASLPSVVLGFLAAQWLAPLIENRVPSVLLLIILLPASAFTVGWGWSRMPMRWRSRLKPGQEFIAFLPILALVAWGAWLLGPLVERAVFTVPDPHGGGRIADFRMWWESFSGAKFEQRNSLVVGFMMGFAVIPIIFTIAEDALSNVPRALRSGSLALGASRWQTAMSVVVPTASAGVFSALMIGLGRAIGETMIVVMATGNTPIMDFDIFNGLRTLSANIAVELPEASEGGTLYRTLFLGALLLFLMTFVINTVAEVLRQHLREKYKTS